LDRGTGFVEQRRKLYRALSSTDHDDVPSLEAAEVPVIGRMGDKSCREPGVRFGSMGVVAESYCHHDRPTLHFAPILQRDEKLIVLALDRGNVRLVDVRHGPLLKPEAIGDERLDRHGIALFVLRLLEEAFE